MILRLLAVLIGLGGVLGAAPSEGEACKAPDSAQAISTDRPAFTNASTTVPCRTLQFESGFNETAAGGRRGWDGPQTLARFGLTSTTELRLALPDAYQNAEAAGTFASGAGDLSIGIQQQLGPLRSFDLSAIAAFSLPSGSQGVSSCGYDATLQLPWSRKISGWTAAGMLQTSWPTVNGRHSATGLATVELDRQLTGAWDAFGEYAGTFPSRGSPGHVIDFGTSYKLTGNQQIDLRGGAGLSAAAVEHFVGVGYSFRFNFYRGL